MAQKPGVIAPSSEPPWKLIFLVAGSKAYRLTLLSTPTYSLSAADGEIQIQARLPVRPALVSALHDTSGRPRRRRPVRYRAARSGRSRQPLHQNTRHARGRIPPALRL